MIAALPSVRVDDVERRRALRTAFGRFATGVAIVTARSPEGRLAGLTINSFASVSLDPPLVSWSLAASASSLPIFAAARFHAISVLSAAQRGLALRFARHDIDRFAGVASRDGPYGTVLIDGALAQLVCRVRELRETGDHTMFVSEVVDQDCDRGEPLIFHA